MLWPKTIIVDIKSLNMITAKTTDEENKNLNPIFNVERFSDRNKVLRITGYVLRFIISYHRTHNYSPKPNLNN